MSMSVPESLLTPDQLAVIAGFDRTRADALDNALAGGSGVLVEYTASGVEGTDFMVSIGTTLAADTYDVGLLGLEDAVSHRTFKFPAALAGDRTTTQFRVQTSGALTAGDVVAFLIIE